eukprot:295680-Pelagomonas_calceolata.AAC.1
MRCTGLHGHAWMVSWRLAAQGRWKLSTMTTRLQPNQVISYTYVRAHTQHTHRCARTCACAHLHKTKSAPGASRACEASMRRDLLPLELVRSGRMVACRLAAAALGLPHAPPAFPIPAPAPAPSELAELWLLRRTGRLAAEAAAAAVADAWGPLAALPGREGATGVAVPGVDAGLLPPMPRPPPMPTPPLPTLSARPGVVLRELVRLTLVLPARRDMRRGGSGCCMVDESGGTKGLPVPLDAREAAACSGSKLVLGMACGAARGCAVWGRGGVLPLEARLSSSSSMHSAAAVSGVWLDVVAPLLPLVRAPVTAADARGGGCAATVAP